MVVFHIKSRTERPIYILDVVFIFSELEKIRKKKRFTFRQRSSNILTVWAIFFFYRVTFPSDNITSTSSEHRYSPMHQTRTKHATRYRTNRTYVTVLRLYVKVLSQTNAITIEISDYLHRSDYLYRKLIEKTFE